jgi:enoyl-CoA hydratase/carnithine racemase
LSFIAFLRDGPVATITLNRPDRRNAIDTPMAEEIEAALDEIESDESIRIGILRANTIGDKPVFCSGYDLSSGAGPDHGGFTERGGFAGLTHRDRTKPLIASVDGFAVAGGFEIVLSCDLIVASPRSSFGLAEVKWNLVAAAGGIFRLTRIIGRPMAMDVLLTGSPLPAERAYQLGLVSRLGDDVDGLAKELAATIAGNAPLAVRLTRGGVATGEYLDDAAAFAYSDSLAAAVTTSQDAAEGVQAFLEKRQPVWTGR